MNGSAHSAVDGNNDAGGTSQAGVPPSGSSSAEGVVDGINAIYQSATQAISNLIELISLETHHAGLEFMWMMAWSTFAVLLVATGWFGLMAGLAVWIISYGLSAAAVIFGLSLINLFVAVLIFLGCVKKSRALSFPATRRQLSAIASQIGRP